MGGVIVRLQPDQVGLVLLLFGQERPGICFVAGPKSILCGSGVLISIPISD